MITSSINWFGTLPSRLVGFLKLLETFFWSIASIFISLSMTEIGHSSSNNLSFGRLPASSPLNKLVPTSLLTAGVRPKRFHSHNDSCVSNWPIVNHYVVSNGWMLTGSKKVPLYHALSLGAGSSTSPPQSLSCYWYWGHELFSVEADVRVVNGTLLVCAIQYWHRNMLKSHFSRQGGAITRILHSNYPI